MSGSVEVGELIPVIFNKASGPQHHLMRHLVEYENAQVCVLTPHRIYTQTMGRVSYTGFSFVVSDIDFQGNHHEDFVIVYVFGVGERLAVLRGIRGR